MLVVDLHCAQGHLFEGWFASADELSSQKEHGLLSCPVCGDHDVDRRPSATRLNTSSLKERPAPASHTGSMKDAARSTGPHAGSASQDAGQTQEAREMMSALQGLYLKAVRHVIEHSEDVGERFAQEARSIHHGDAPERAIRGQASAEEKQALLEEGIEVLSLPVPKAIKGTLQ